jgi:acyl carrier protein
VIQPGSGFVPAPLRRPRNNADQDEPSVPPIKRTCAIASASIWSVVGSLDCRGRSLCDAGHRSVGRNAVAILSRSEHPVQMNRKGTHAMKTEIFDKVADIIAETSDIPRDTIKLESHAINDLGIDSLDFLDIAFAIDKAFGIKLPLEQWTQDVNDGKATTEQYFVLDNLCASIDGLVAAKMAKAA